MDSKSIRQLQILIVTVFGAVSALMLYMEGWASKDWISMALLGVSVWAGLDAQFPGPDGVKPRHSRLVISAIAIAGSLGCKFLVS